MERKAFTGSLPARMFEKPDIAGLAPKLGGFFVYYIKGKPRKRPKKA